MASPHKIQLSQSRQLPTVLAPIYILAYPMKVQASLSRLVAAFKTQSLLASLLRGHLQRNSSDIYFWTTGVLCNSRGRVHNVSTLTLLMSPKLLHVVDTAMFSFSHRITSFHLESQQENFCLLVLRKKIKIKDKQQTKLLGSLWKF